MNSREDFIEKLREALMGEVNADVINENIRFYEDYFMTEMRKGRSEEDVLLELGDPRLIARTIIDTSGAGDAARNRTYYEEEESTPYEEGQTSRKVYRMPGWLLAVIILAVVVVLLVAVGSLVVYLLPVIVPVAIVVLLVQFIRRN